MVICFYGAANEGIDEVYKTECYNLANMLAKRGHSLIFGAGSTGIMGSAANGFFDGGAKVHGVIPKFFEDNHYEGIFYKATELEYTNSMAERKTKMEDGCNAFIIGPGGIGTLEEFFEALTLKQLGRHTKPIVIYNINGVYDMLDKYMDFLIENKFINEECKKLYAVLNNKKEIIEYIENYSTLDIEWNRLKK